MWVVYSRYRAAAQHSRAVRQTLSPGLYLGYLGFASSRNGFCVLVPNANHGCVPAVKLDLPKADCDAFSDAGAAWRWVRGLRPRIDVGGEHPLDVAALPDPSTGEGRFAAAFVGAIGRLRRDINEEKRSEEDMVKHLYDVRTFPVDRHGTVRLIVVAHPKGFPNTKRLPVQFKRSFSLQSMNIFEPLHFSLYFGDLYAQLQQEALERHRDAAEAKWTLQHSQDLAQNSNKFSELRRVIKERQRTTRREVHRLDALRWPLKLIDWASAADGACMVDLFAAGGTGKSIAAQVDEAVEVFDTDKFEQLELKALKALQEASAWTEVGMRMEKLGMVTSTFRLSGQYRQQRFSTNSKFGSSYASHSSRSSGSSFESE